MKIIHEFNTEVDGDMYAELGFRLGAEFRSNLHDIDQFCRSLLKYSDESDETKAVVSQIREMIDSRIFD